MTSRRGRTSFLLAPVSGWAWRSTAHLMLGFPIGIVTFVLTLVLVALTAGLLVTAVFAAITMVMLIGTTRAFTAMQRSRFYGVLGEELTPIPRRRLEGSWVRWLLAEARSGDTWRQVTYHLFALVPGTLGFAVLTTLWSVGLAGVTVFAYSPALPEDGLLGLSLNDPVALAEITALGIVALLAAPWVALALTELDVAAARALLQPSRAEVLQRRVEGVVDAADAERRRIERDLHDGTQQRLVSLAMNLGMARAKVTDAPAEVREAVEEAHDEAKQALAELRGFIRGLHPAVLDDRGLDAALSGIAARAPLPVDVEVDIPSRCSPTVEAVAYFVVAEALTNIARHALATRARVTVRQAQGRLRVEVSDDGRGGATSTGAGSGLRGLAQRVSSVDGALRVDSPAGGPTVIVAELPCER